jgi:hypothetical protein
MDVFIDFSLHRIEGCDHFFLFVLARLNDQVELFLHTETLLGFEIDQFHQLEKVTLDCLWV